MKTRIEDEDRRNDDIRKDVKVLIVERIKEYRQYWKSHMECMVDTHSLKQVLKFRPGDRRNHGKQQSLNGLQLNPWNEDEDGQF